MQKQNQTTYFYLTLQEHCRLPLVCGMLHHVRKGFKERGGIIASSIQSVIANQLMHTSVVFFKDNTIFNFNISPRNLFMNQPNSLDLRL